VLTRHGGWPMSVFLLPISVVVHFHRDTGILPVRSVQHGQDARVTANGFKLHYNRQMVAADARTTWNIMRADARIDKLRRASQNFAAGGKNPTSHFEEADHVRPTDLSIDDYLPRHFSTLLRGIFGGAADAQAGRSGQSPRSLAPRRHAQE
jgi:hypothetical protein